MSKKMNLEENFEYRAGHNLLIEYRAGHNLLIEKDSGNPILILMGGTEESQKDSWRRLRALCDRALEGLGVRRTKAEKAAADLARALEDLMDAEGGEPQDGNEESMACWSAAGGALRAWKAGRG